MANSRSKVGYTAPTGKTSLVDQMNLSIHLRKYIKLITRRWLFLVAGAAIGTGYMWHQAKNTPDTYQTWSKVMIKPILIGASSDQVKVIEEMQKFYLTQIDYINSDAVLGKVTEKLKDVKKPDGGKPTLGTSANQGLSASIVMTVNSDDFDYARRFAEAWADEFIIFKDSLKSDLVNQAASEARFEFEREKDKLGIVLKEMEDFVNKHGANAKDIGDGAQALLEQLEKEEQTIRLQLELLQNQELDKYAEDQGNKLQPRRNDTGTSAETENPRDTNLGIRYSDLKELKQALLQAERERDRWVGILKPKHPFLKQLNDNVAKLQNTMDDVRKLAKEAYDAHISSLRKHADGLKPMIAERKQGVKEARAIQEQYSQIQLKYQEQTKRVAALEDRLEVLGDARQANETFSIMEKGKGGLVAIDRNRMILNGLLMGLAVGFAIIYFLNRMDDRLELAEDIEDELDEPVLGQIPQLDKGETADGVVLVTKLEQHNTFAEAMRGVRSAFLFGSRDTPKQVLVVTSAVPGDGKTTMTVNFAATLAKAGNKILLIDADLRRGNIHQYFGMERDGGLTEILAGESHWQDVVRKTPIETLDLVTTGRLPGNPGELLISSITGQFVADARKHYDHVLFDCPPLTSIDDTFCLLSLVDGLLFVVKAGHTSMRFARNALAAVRHRGCAIIGINLNGITTDHPGYYYYYYYHDYYKTAQDAALKGQPLIESQPGQKMASRKSAPEGVNGHAHSHPATPLGSTGEQEKAQLFKARRNAGKSASPPNQAAETPPKNISSEENKPEA